MASFVELKCESLSALVPFWRCDEVLAAEEFVRLGINGLLVNYVDDDGYAVVECVSWLGILLL